MFRKPKIQQLATICLIISIIGISHIYQVYADETISSPTQYQPFVEGNFNASTFPNIESEILELVTVQENSFLATLTPETEQRPKKIINQMVLVTAYSSSVWETDSTPFVTASGAHVREGTAAANFLPFGAKIKLPALYGNKTFIIEDRMHERYWYHIDIWMPSYWEARAFGAKWTMVEIML